MPEMLCVADLVFVGVKSRSLRSDLKRRDQGLANDQADEMK